MVTKKRVYKKAVKVNKKQTDLKRVLEETKVLFMAVPIKSDSILLNHPMLNSTAVIDPDTKEFIVLDTEEKIESYTRSYLKHMDEWCTDLVKTYILVRSPYKLLWFKLVKDYLSEEDFAHYLEDAWISEENPNMDVNVSRKESLSYFKSANKHYLMNEEDYKHWENLPDYVDIYRGVSVGREPYGLSWTDDLEKAEWFMNRFNRDSKSGYLLKARVPKELIVGYFNTRNEAECLLDVFKAKKLGLIERV